MIGLAGLRAASARRTIYWRARRGLLLTAFGVRRTTYRARALLSKARDDASIMWSFARTALFTLVGAVGAAMALQFVIGPRIEFPDTWPAVNREDYSALLQTVASVTGVFLALHFGAATTVAGTTYGNVPTCVRDFYVGEKFGNTYVRFLLLVTAFAVALMTLSAFGFEPQPIALPVLAMVSIPAMVAFTHLVRYHFRLLDPTVLAEQVAHELFRAIRSATRKGYAWKDPSFQQHNHDLALGSMRVIDALCEVAARDDGKGAAACARLGQIIVTSLQMYASEKHAIPPDSRWFERRPRAANWYLSNASILQMADEMGTALHPTEVPEPHWFERRMLASLRRVLVDRMHADRRPAVHVLIGLAARARFFAGEFDVRALDAPLYEVLGAVVDASVAQPSGRAIDDLAFIEAACLVSIESLIGFLVASDDLESFDYDGCIRGCRSARHAALHATRRPAAVQQRLVRVQRQLAFEVAVEDKQVTPDWFVRHQIQSVLGHEFAESLQILVDRATWFQGRAEACIKIKSHRHAAVLASRGVEYVTRLSNHMERLQQAFETLTPAFNATDWHVASVDWTKHRDALGEAASKLEHMFAQLIVYLGSAKDLGDDLPDLLGEAVHRTAVALLRHLESGTSATLPPLIAAYFHGSLIVFNRHRGLPHGTDVEGHVLLSLEPVFDLMCLSGLAYAWSELHRRPDLWEPWKEAWEVFFSDTAMDRYALVVTALKLKQSSMRMLERDVTRIGWIRGLERALDSLPTETRRRRHRFSHDVIVQHESSLIRELGRYRPVSTMAGGIDIFVDCWLRKQLGFNAHGLRRPRVQERDESDTDGGADE